MIAFAPAAWDDGFMDWIAAAVPNGAEAGNLVVRVQAGDAAVMVARSEGGEVVGLMVVSIWGFDLMVEAVAGGACVMRAAIAWSKDMCARLGLKRATARTFQPGVVYHMARAGARLDAAYLSWEA
jgi:hypothetical protein